MVICANDITEIKSRAVAQEREMEEFRQMEERMLSMNPSSLCTFRINLTQNRYSEGHGVSQYIRRLLRSDSADGLLNNIVAIIPDSAQRRQAAEFFDRARLQAVFRAGETSQSIDYMRRDEDDRPFWVRTYIDMLKNPETQDIIGVFYSMDISAEKRQEEIFDLITGEEYDFVALLHGDIGKIEFLNVGRKLPRKYHDAYGKPGILMDFEAVRRAAVEDWIDPEDRGLFLKAGSVEAVRRALDAQGQYVMSIRGRKAGDPDEVICRRIQHYYLGEGRDTILIIQSDVTATYLRQQKETQRAKSESEQLSDILDRLTAGICVLKMPDAGHVYTTFCNRQMYRMLEITPNASTLETMEKDGDPLVAHYFQNEFSGAHPDDRQRMRELFRRGYDQERFTVPNIRYLG